MIRIERLFCKRKINLNFFMIHLPNVPTDGGIFIDIYFPQHYKWTWEPQEVASVKMSLNLSRWRKTNKKFAVAASFLFVFLVILSYSQLNYKMSLFNCEFEVFGKVQGVFFRKYTQKKATELSLSGWCMNTRDDTVKGELEGVEEKINEMKIWLEKTGSPSSIITKATFSPLKPIDGIKSSGFSIRK